MVSDDSIQLKSSISHHNDYNVYVWIVVRSIYLFDVSFQDFPYSIYLAPKYISNMPLYNRGMKTHSYSAPICLTLSGDDVTAFGRPAVMISIKKHVVVMPTDIEVEPDSLIDEVYADVFKEVYGKAPKKLRSMKVYTPYDSSLRAVQAALIVCFSAYLLAQKGENKPSESDIQRIAYAVERKRFQQFSHAQTVCCTQGGLIYYRKEFEFYKTTVKLPMKLPKGFLSKLEITAPKSSKGMLAEFSAKALTDSEKLSKRLVFAISQERKADWIECLLQNKNTSDLYFSSGKESFEESLRGLTELE